MQDRPTRRLGITQRVTGVMIAVSVMIGASDPAAAGAQSAPRDQPIPPFSAAYLSTGTLLVDVSRLNPHFERLDLAVKERPGFFTISNDAYSVGIGAYGTVMNKLVLGAEWNSADLGEESSPLGKTNRLTTTYWMGTVGYAVFTTWRVNIVPLVGIGPGTATLTLKNRDGGETVPDFQDPTIDEIILSPGRKSTVTGSYIIVQPGLAIDFLMLRQTTNTVGVTLGIRLASAISPNRTTWTYKGRPVFGGPDLGPSGGVVRVIAGIGGFRMGSSSR